MAWSWLQSANGVNSLGATSTVSATYTTANLSSGSTLFAAVSCFGHTTSGVADASSNQFVKIKSGLNSGVGDTSLWALNTPAGDAGTKPQITATFSQAAKGVIVIQEVSGIITSTTQAGFTDGTPATLVFTAANSPQGPPAYASAVSNEYLIYVAGCPQANPGFTAPGLYNTDTGSFQSTSGSVVIAYGNSTGGTEAGAYTWSGGTETGSLIMVAFQITAASPAVQRYVYQMKRMRW